MHKLNLVHHLKKIVKCKIVIFSELIKPKITNVTNDLKEIRRKINKETLFTKRLFTKTKTLSTPLLKTSRKDRKKALKIEQVG